MKIRFTPDKINEKEAIAAKQKPEKHLFKYKEFQKQLSKDLQKAKNFLGEQPETEMNFYLSVEHKYGDREKVDRPIFVVGNPAGTWKKFLKNRILNAQTKKTDAIGTFCFKESTNGKFVELTILKGKAKPKIIKKQLEKWLLPGGLEIRFGGDDDLGSEDSSDIGATQNSGGPELDAKDKVQALFIALKNGKYDETPQKVHQIKVKIKTFIEKWLRQYDTLSDVKQEKLKDKKAIYEYITDELDKMDNDSDSSDNSAPQVELDNSGDEIEERNPNEIYRDTQIGVDGDEKLPKPGMFGSAYEKLYKAMQAFNNEGDLNRKNDLFRGVMSMANKWINEHKGDFFKPDQFDAVKKMLLNNKHLLKKTKKASLSDKEKNIHQTGEKLTDETSGTHKSSDIAKEVRDATIDDRAIKLAEILDLGNASNSDTTFGSIMKWLADNSLNELEEKYAEATKKMKSNKSKEPSDLIGDILSVFEPGSLRTRYLIDKLRKKESPYAKLAFALGLLGKTWFSTVELDDSSGIIKGYKPQLIDAIWEADDVTTYEGAINECLNKDYKKLVQQIKAQVELKQAREGDDLDVKNEANDIFLTNVIDKLKDESLIGRLDPNKLINELMEWGMGASEDELNHILRGPMMAKLTEMSSSTSVSGLDSRDLIYIKDRLNGLLAQKERENKKPNDEETQKSNKDQMMLDHLKGVLDKQKDKNSFSKWLDDKDIGNEIKGILFGENVKDTQKSIINKFLADSEKDGKTEEEQLESAYTKLQSLMDEAGVHHDLQIEIKDLVESNGRRGEVYQKLMGMASDPPFFSFGEKVINELKKLDLSNEKDQEQLTEIISNDELLQVLRNNSKDEYWETIKKILGKDVQKTKDEKLVDKRTKNPERISRAKLNQENKEEVGKRKSTPEFWAARLSYEYNKGVFSTDEHKLLQTMFEAQKALSSPNTIDTVMEDELRSLNKKAYDYIKTKDNHACKSIQSALNSGAKIKAKDVFSDSRESVWLQRKVDYNELETLVSTMSESELLEEFFDFDTLKKLIADKKSHLGTLADSNLSSSEREVFEKSLAKLNDQIKQFDISSGFQDEIDRVVSAEKALKIKKAIRFKLGDKLMEKDDNEAKKLLREQAGFSKADIQLLGADIKAISNIETEMQSETGIQWSSLSSRMLQRDVAAADYLTKGWDKNDKLEVLSGRIPEEDLEKEKETLLKGLQESETKLQEAQAKFEERKAQYDARLEAAVSALMNAIVFTLSMASGVGAAAGVLQLVWALSSTLMKTAADHAIKVFTKGDRTGGALQKAEDFFFDALAQEAGAISGMIGANLAFALDVKALGTFSQGKGSDGKALLSSWENILKTPLLKTAKSSITGIFNDIGTNFVKNLTDEKHVMPDDPIASLQDWGENQLKSLPRKAAKTLLMTAVTTGVGELVKDNDDLKAIFGFKNPDAAGANRNTSDQDNNPLTSENTEFKSSDARLGFFDTDKKSFEDWFNGWGMFDASPTFGIDAKDAGNHKPEDGFFDVFAKAVEGLKDPKMLTALANAAVWGTMDGTGGIKGELGKLVDNSIDHFVTHSDVPLDEATRKMLLDKKDALQEEMSIAVDGVAKEKLAEIQKAIGEKCASNLSEEQKDIIQNKPEELEIHQILDLWEEMNYIGNGDAHRNLEFFNYVAKIIGLSDKQIKLYRRESECHKFKSIRAFRTHYAGKSSKYDTILNNQDFVNQYVKDRSNKGRHPTGLNYTLVIDDNESSKSKKLENDLISIYDIWKKMKQLSATDDIEVKDIQFIF